MFGPLVYTLVNIKVFRPSFLNKFFFKKSYLFHLLKKPRNGRFRSEILRFVFFSHIFVSLEYNLVNIKVVSALVAERIYFQEMLST